VSERNALPLETRSVDQVIGEVRERAQLAAADPLSDALLRIFGRYFEIVATRLNAAPEKHHLVFLDLLGTRAAPPGAARVPLTFTPVAQFAQLDRGAALTSASVSPAIVPARAQVAAAVQGAGDAPVFETERTLELTGAVLTQVLAHAPETDYVGDYSLLATETLAGVRPLVDQMRPAHHEFCIAWPAALGEDVSSIGVHFDIEPGSFGTSGRTVEWFMAGPEPQKLRPLSDTTEGLTRSGDVVFANFGAWPAYALHGVEARWLICKLVSRLPRSRSTLLEESRGPAIRRIAISARVEVRGVLAQSAYFNSQPLELSAGIYPLGFSPRFGDVFYLGSPLFAYPDAEVTLRFRLANAGPAPRDAADLSLRALDRPPLVWEAVSDGQWVRLDAEDGTHGLLESGHVRLRLPHGAGPIAVNGLETGWVRVRVAALTPRERDRISPPVIESGREAAVPVVPPPPFLPAIERVRIDASKGFAAIPVASIVRTDDVSSALFEISLSSPVPPFERMPSDDPALYLRFDGATRDLGAGTTVFFFMLESPEGSVSDSADRSPSSMRVEYWDGGRWRAADIADATRGLTRTGPLTLRCERPWRAGPFATGGAFWARLVWPDRQQARPGLLARVALNTVMAINALSVENELLGSSDHTADQLYTCARRPVIGELQLEVREPAAAPPLELAARRVGGQPTLSHADALPGGTGREQWVRWQAVESFTQSGPEDRHFVLNAWNGSVRFGDGRTGKIPPAGANNIRMRRYRAGGGSAGNVPSHAISELRATVSYVSAVTNLIPSSGGSDHESVQRIADRGSAWLRHRDRAVTREDYEDLARAVPGIARARCVPLRDLDADPEGRRAYPGRISVIVVPDDASVAPKPSASQLRRVHEHLANRKPPETILIVLAPSYVMVDVAAEIVCDEDEDTGQLAAECRRRLDAYLHPVTGGPTGNGWRFGQRAVQSGLSAVLQGVEGVRQVRSLDLGLREERPGLMNTRLYLISPGRHEVRCIGAPRFVMEAS